MANMALVLLLLLSSALSSTVKDLGWEEFQLRHSRSYSSLAEAEYRQSVWQQEMDMVNTHNAEAEAGLHSYTLGENQFSDWTLQEFLHSWTGYNETYDLADLTLESPVPPLHEGQTFPETWDNREQGLVGPVRSQGGCGSCWAFSAVGAVEGAWAKKTGKLYRLSEQELVDCDKSGGGCHGGGISSALTWVHSHHGLAPNSDYGVGHYHHSQGTCHHKDEETVATITRIRHVQSKNEADLKRAVYKAGPVSMSLHVNSKFKAYKSGIFNDPSCPNTNANHALLVVGWQYSSAQEKTKWIVKNSWGSAWGQKGYIYLEYGKNVCGMAKSPLYAEA